MSNPPYPTGYRPTQSTPVRHENISDGDWSPDWSVTDDGKGLLTGTMRFFWNAPSNKPRTSIVKAGDSHPKLPELLCNAVQTTLTANDISYVEASYVGLAQDPAGVTWAINTPTEDEPIESHPDFAKIDKGWGMVTKEGYNPLNNQPYWNSKNVIVSTDGRFEGFKYNDHNIERGFVGVTSFKFPRATASLTFFTANLELVQQAQNSLRKIASIPFVDIPTPTLDGTYNWLVTNVSVSPFSDTIFQVQVEYLLSGDRGWNPLIYPNAR